MTRPDWSAVVAAAVRAPSIHNTQPWAFVGHPDRLDLRFDRERALPVVDPTGREQVFSCGAALEFAVVALHAAGFDTDVRERPSPGEDDLLATVVVTGSREVAEEDRALRAAIDARRTARGTFAHDRTVPAELVDAWAAEARQFGVWIETITREADEVAAAVVLSQAEESQRQDPAYLEELRRWVREDPAAADGVPLAAVPDEPTGRVSNWQIRDFRAADRNASAFLPPQDPDAPPPTVERPTVLLLGSGSDDAAAWLQTGRAFGRMLLRATAAGIGASPLTQALDWPATRTRLRSRLSLAGYPQMLLRMGYRAGSSDRAGSGDEVISGRRPVAEVLEIRQD